MAKRSVSGRKASGTAGIAIIEDPADEVAGDAATIRPTDDDQPATPKREKKAKSEPPQETGFNVADVRKAAAFVNSVGGLDKAIAVLQILKVAKEVQ